MNKDELQQKIGVEVIDTPTVFKEDDETRVDLKLKCGHVVNSRVKTLVKRKPRCTKCHPPKKRDKQPITNDDVMKKISELFYDSQAVYQNVSCCSAYDNMISYEDFDLDKDEEIEDNAKDFFIYQLVDIIDQEAFIKIYNSVMSKRSNIVKKCGYDSESD